MKEKVNFILRQMILTVSDIRNSEYENKKCKELLAHYVNELNTTLNEDEKDE